jgi:hypothetical protein
MLKHRFGRKIKLPSTAAIKHEILKLMLQDHLKAQVLNTTAIEGIDAEGRSVAEETERLRQSAPVAVPIGLVDGCF